MEKITKTFVHACLYLLICFSAQADFSREYIDQHPLNVTDANGIQVSYRLIGQQQNPVVLMVMGLGASHLVWGDEMVKGLERAGFQVLLFDNRDVGGSTRFDEWGEPTLWWQLLKYTLGFEVDAPYSLYDMASDAVALMDVLNIEKAHVVGASMGGMIAQILAARYPDRTESLTSIMSTTNAPHLPRPSGDAENSLRNLAEGEAGEERAEAMRKRGFNIEAIPRQIMGILITGDRTQEVATITVPTLVLHGEDDPLIQVVHGEHTSETIQGSKLVTFAGMGHSIPETVLPELLNTMVMHLNAVIEQEKQTLSKQQNKQAITIVSGVSIP